LVSASVATSHRNAVAQPAPGVVALQDFDVVVYSGVPCGIAAALAAKRAGARVLLIEPTRHVGGLSTSGINTAESEHMLAWTIGGIALEFYEWLGRHYGTGKPEFYFESSVAERIYLEMLREAGVEIHYGASVEQVEKQGTRIVRIALTDGATVRARVFIDAGYEGVLMARAGVASVFGREARAEFSEEAAGIRFDKTPRKARTVDDRGSLLPGINAWAKDLRPGEAHRGVMNYNFRLTITRDPRAQVPIPPAENYDRERYALLADWLKEASARGETIALRHVLGMYPRRNGKVELNNHQAAIISLGHFGGQFQWPDADYAMRRRIYRDHLDYTLGLLHFLANDDAVPPTLRKEMKAIGLHRDEFADNQHLPYQLYVREARRMRGAYIVTQRDVTEDRRKSDSIGICSHFIDSHHVQRVALSPTEFVNEGRIWRLGHAWQMPYRMLTPKPAECENLLVPGAASLTHVAFCSYRLESVWMIAGHAAGLAGALAARDTGRIHAVDIAVLQRMLREQKQVVDFVPGAPEKCTELNGPPEF
jgi:hypothetical protein